MSISNEIKARDVLLKLIHAAPDPIGFRPHYFEAWSEARAFLEATCPDHEDDGGTCPHCHKDMME